MKLMEGFPPAPEGQVTLANWRKPPFNRWSFNHVSELVPSAQILCAERPEPLTGGDDLDTTDLSVHYSGKTWSFSKWLEDTYTDSMIILKNGQVVYETYAPGQSPRTPHLLMSVSKSILGLMAGIAVGRGELSLTAKLTDIIPEIANSAFSGATVQNALDMRVGVRFSENYLATDGDMIEYRKAQQWDPMPPGEAPSDLRSFFGTLKASDGGHGERFHYISPNTDLLGWVLERATGQRYADFVSDALWQPLGAETNAYITVDRLGAPRCAGGFCATLRDFSRIGRLFITGGSIGNKQVVPSAWIEDIVNNGDAHAWRNGDFFKEFEEADMHYRNKWYVLRGKHPLVFGSGAFGQNVFADAHSDLVIAKFSTQPLALDSTSLCLTLAGVEALRQAMR